MSKSKWCILCVVLTLFVFALTTDCAFAEGGSGGLPYEAWLTKLRQSIQGPFAFSMSIIGIVISGCTLIFGGDLNGFFRSMVFIILVIALVICSDNILTSFMGQSELVSQANVLNCIS